jgi:hypothetical protein
MSINNKLPIEGASALLSCLASVQCRGVVGMSALPLALILRRHQRRHADPRRPGSLAESGDLASSQDAMTPPYEMAVNAGRLTRTVRHKATPRYEVGSVRVHIRRL